MDGSIRTTRKTRLATGDMIHERYEIGALLGRGGMAQVFRGRDRVMDRIVAIKILDLPIDDLDDDQRQEALDRFEREIKASARITHPNAITVFDAGVLQDGDHPYMVMELLSGRDLEAELRIKGPLATDRALSLCLNALDALAIAHAEGIVHKDLKPSNLFLKTDHGQESLCVVDFGVAHIVQDPKGRLTHTGFMCGTPQYLAPEYVSGRDILPAGDVYQMGLILIEMLTGIPVVNEPTPYKCLMRHGNGDLELPDNVMSSALGPVLKLALALTPEARFQHAGAFAEALRTIDMGTLAIAAPSPQPTSISDKETAIAPAGVIEAQLKETQLADPDETTPTQAPEPAPPIPPPRKSRARLYQALAVALLLMIVIVAGIVIGLLIARQPIEDAGATSPDQAVIDLNTDTEEDAVEDKEELEEPSDYVLVTPNPSAPKAGAAKKKTKPTKKGKKNKKPKGKKR